MINNLLLILINLLLIIPHIWYNTFMRGEMYVPNVKRFFMSPQVYSYAL